MILVATVKTTMRVIGFPFHVCVPSFEIAPSTKKSQPVSAATAAAAPAARNLLVRRDTRIFLSCSKTVYCSTGFITSISAGPTPRQNALSMHDERRRRRNSLKTHTQRRPWQEFFVSFRRNQVSLRAWTLMSQLTLCGLLETFV